MANENEIGGIEFERDPSKVDPALDPNKNRTKTHESDDQPLPKREHYSEIKLEPETSEDNLESQPGKSQPEGRQTDPMSDFEREQQPVVNHQDRRHK